MAEVAALKALLTQLPLTEQQRQQAEELIKKCTLEELQELGLCAPARPVVPKGLDKLSPQQHLQAVQRVISSLHYNHAPGYMYNVCKDRPHSAIMNTAREVLRDALPIKCVEATFLGMLLTSNWPELERLPVGFKSKCAGQAYRHIVLAVHHVPSGQWGALGISRRPDLQYKELGTASSLADLMWNYKACYAGWGHLLYKIRVGLPAEHDPAHNGPVCWRYCNVSCGRHSWDRCKLVLNTFADNTRVLANRFKVLGFRPPSRGGHEVCDPAGSRVALSGTTPEPGAARPPLGQPGTSILNRHASVSPMKRRGGPPRPERSELPAGKGALAANSPMATRRSPSKARPGCASAPTRQRPSGAGEAGGSTVARVPGTGKGVLLPSTHESPGRPPRRPGGGADNLKQRPAIAGGLPTADKQALLTAESGTSSSGSSRGNSAHVDHPSSGSVAPEAAAGAVAGEQHAQDALVGGLVTAPPTLAHLGPVAHAVYVTSDGTRGQHLLVEALVSGSCSDSDEHEDSGGDV